MINFGSTKECHPAIVTRYDLLIPIGTYIALMGDFYGHPDSEPISDGLSSPERINRFEAAYQTLDRAATKEITRILKNVTKEEKLVQQAKKEGKKPSIVLERGTGIRHQLQFARATGWSFFRPSLLDSRYFALLKKNVDHFGLEAKSAYEAGHALAMAKANVAFNILNKKNEKYALLADALKTELAACHFLTDAFSAGHVRTPRKALIDHVKSHRVVGALWVAGILANRMHDEENWRGVYLESEKGGRWLAFGDGCYFDSQNAPNAKRACAAVVAGLTAVLMQFCNDTSLEADYLKYFPKASPDQITPISDSEQNRKSFLPLFDDSAPPRLRNHEGTGYVSNWSICATTARLLVKTSPLVNRPQEKPGDEFEVEQATSEVQQLLDCPDDELQLRAVSAEGYRQFVMKKN